MKGLLKYIILFFLYSCNQAIDQDQEPKGFFPIKEFGKWGYIDNSGKTVIKCQFDWAGQFSEGLAPFREDSLYGFIDTSGEIIIKPIFYRVSEFSDELCQVLIQKDTSFIDAFIKKDGNIAFISSFEDVGPFRCGKAMVRINNEVCFINKTGTVVINTHYPHGSGFQYPECIAKIWGGTEKWVLLPDGSNVREGDTTKYIDTTGKVITILEGMGYEDFSEGLASVKINDKPFYIDKTGKPKILPEQTDLVYFNFSDGLARVTKPGINHKTGFIDTTGKTVIPIIYDYVSEFKDGLAAFQENGKLGFINKKGEIVIKPQFDQVDYDLFSYVGFNNGLCRARQNQQWGYINKMGKFIWKEQFGLEYEKLDLSKWDLDTLESNNPLYAERRLGKNHTPRQKVFNNLNNLTLQVDTTDITVFADRYYAYKLYLVNASKDSIKIPAQSSRIKLIQQARNKKGQWQDIENYFNDWCGNSYHTVKLLPNEYQIHSIPIFKGEYKTQLRFKFELPKQEFYSNAYTGYINLGQLLNPKDKDKTGIAVWAE